MEIYADNAATTALSPLALEAMLPFFDQTYANPSSLHDPGQRAAEALAQARESIAQCLGCSAQEIYFTSGGSEADTQALLSAAALGEKRGKKHLVSTAFEHHAILRTLEALAKRGFEVTLLEIPDTGIISPDQVRKAIRPDTCLVSVMFANNEIGTIQPISEIGALCQEAGVLFHTDAVQAVGHIPVQIQDSNIDLLSLSGHKFHGPKGIGALYAKKGIRLQNLIYGGAQERGKRAGTENVPAIVGVAAALKEACALQKQHQLHLCAMRDKLIEGLARIPHSALSGSAENRLPGNVHFCFEGIEGESLLLLLSDKGIYASSGSACTSGSLEPSHVLLALGRPHEVAHGSLRLSLDESITEQEVDYLIDSITDVVAYLRSISPLWQELIAGEKDFIL